MHLYLVEGEHPYVPGIHRSLHRTFASAQRRAKELRELVRPGCKGGQKPGDFVFIEKVSIVDE